MIVKAKILRGDNCGDNVKELPLEKKMKALYQMYFSCLIYLRKKVMIILQMSQREVESTQYILPAEFEINCGLVFLCPALSSLPGVTALGWKETGEMSLSDNI